MWTTIVIVGIFGFVAYEYLEKRFKQYDEEMHRLYGEVPYLRTEVTDLRKRVFELENIHLSEFEVSLRKGIVPDGTSRPDSYFARSHLGFVEGLTK